MSERERVRYHQVHRGEIRGPSDASPRYEVDSTCRLCAMTFTTSLPVATVVMHFRRRGPMVRRWMFRWRKRLRIAGRRGTRIWYDDLDAAEDLSLEEVEQEVCPGPDRQWG